MVARIACELASMALRVFGIRIHHVSVAFGNHDCVLRGAFGGSKKSHSMRVALLAAYGITHMRSLQGNLITQFMTA